MESMQEKLLSGAITGIVCVNVTVYAETLVLNPEIPKSL